MDQIHVLQSLPICIALASLGGVMEVAATALTAMPSVREQEQGYPVSSYWRWMTVIGNIFLQTVGGLLSALLATWFGPVSIVVPFFYCATLLSNVIIFGVFLGETFRKPMRVGTHVIVLAVILLPVVGPDVVPEQTFDILCEHWYSIVWLLLLTFITLGTGCILILHASPSNTNPQTNKFLKEYTPMQRTIVLLLCRAATMSVDLTVSRLIILGPPSRIIVGALIATKLVSGNLYTYAIIVQSYSVEQARFVPLNATMVILVNALTGLLIWQDRPQSWYGYLCVFWLLGIGCDLLLSVPLLHSENPDFGTTKNANIILNNEGLTPRKLTLDEDETRKFLADMEDPKHDYHSYRGDTPKRKGSNYQSITDAPASADQGEASLKIPQHLTHPMTPLSAHRNNASESHSCIPRQFIYTNDTTHYDHETHTTGSTKNPMSPLTPMAASYSVCDPILRTVYSTSPESSHASTSTTMSRREAWSEVISIGKTQKRRRTSRTNYGGILAGSADSSYFHTRVVRQPRIPSPIPPNIPGQVAGSADTIANYIAAEDVPVSETTCSSSLTSTGKWSNRGLTSWDDPNADGKIARKPSPLLGSDASEEETFDC